MAQCSIEDEENGIHAEEELNSENSMYRESALDVVSFIAVYDEHDILSPKSSIGHFKPEMAHQVFGEGETIYGYRHLEIDLKYLHNSCRCYVGINYSSKVKDTELAQADNIIEKLNDKLPENFVTDVNVFSKMLEEEDHKKMFGQTLEEFRDRKEMDRFPNKRMYADYKINKCELEEDFKDFHRRFETYITWFIDGANFIDLDDERWLIYYVYEEFLHPENKKLYRSPVGYCTVYRFYNHPEGYRGRISQFFVLPTHQRRSIGKRLYQAVIQNLIEDPQIREITVEEPSPIFQTMRSYVDAAKIYETLRKEGVSISERTERHVRHELEKSKFGKRQSKKVRDIVNCLDEYRRSQRYEATKEAIRARFVKNAERSLKVSARMTAAAGVVVDKEAMQTKEELAQSEFESYMSEIEPIIARLINNVLGSNS